MRFTGQQIDELAKALLASKYKDTRAVMNPNSVVLNVATTIADLIEDHNKEFDRDGFLTACGYTMCEACGDWDDPTTAKRDCGQYRCDSCQGNIFDFA